MKLVGPGNLNLLQQIRFFARPLELLDTWAQQYGETFTVGAKGFPTVVYVSNPRHIQEIFTINAELFDSGKGNGFIKPLSGEHSLLLLDGVSHQRQRRLLMPPFHGERVWTYSKLICDVTKQVMSQWQLGKPFYVRSSMQEISLRVILSAVFGLHSGQRFEQLRQLLSLLLDSVGSPLSSSLIVFKTLQRDLGPWSPWSRFLRRKQQIDQLIYDEIRERREREDFSGPDILSSLMSSRDEVGEPMTDVELRDELITLVVAGNESTASALAWALYWIHYVPEVRDKLLKELNTLSNDASPVEFSRLPYLTAICQETLRIYPMAMFTFSRILKSPLKLIGYQFDAGTVLIPCIYLTHQREELYPEPKRFKPERFLERQFSPYEYLPFGGGNRRCIGAALVQLEMKTVLATILKHFHLALKDSRPAKPIRRGVTLAPPVGMQMVAAHHC